MIKIEKREKKQNPDEVVVKRRSQSAEVWRRFKMNHMAVAGMIFMIALILMAILADVFFDYDKEVITIDILNQLQGPSAEHILGTDELGRDMLARIVHGSRISLLVGAAAVTYSLIIGSALGAIAGYFGGMVETVIMRLVDILQAIPNILLSIAIVASLGQSLPILIFAVGISTIPAYARIVRGSTLTIKGQEYIEAAKAVGASDWKIIIHHIIPNCLAPIIVQASIRMAVGVLAIATLSFLGMGVKPPTPEWGSMMAGGRGYLREAWHITVFPGIAIMLSVLSLNAIGDGLRDALDPKLKR